MAPGIALVLRIGLAAIFAFAALAKLADRRGTAATIRSFGAPAGLAAPLATLIPLAELTTAALLLPDATAAAGCVLALVLLAVFSVAIATNLLRGRRPNCNCFGQVRSAPIGGSNLIRNAVLALAAALVLGMGVGPSAVAPIASSPALALAVGLLAGFAVAAWVGFALTRRYGRALRRIDLLERELLGLGADLPVEEPEPTVPIGDPVPAFDGLAELLAPGRPLLLTFTSPGCAPCRELAPRLEDWRRELGEQITFAELGYDDDPALARAFGANATPAAITIAPDGTAASPVAHGPDAIEDLLEATVSDTLPPPVGIGEPVPAVPLTDLGGDPVPLTAALADGRDTLLLFWNPGCGFCSAMRDQLRGLEAAETGPALVIVSGGERHEVAAERFSCPVLHDPRWRASDALGASGTPVAMLVAADGTVSSKPAAGSAAVFELAGVETDDTGVNYELEVIG